MSEIPRASPWMDRLLNRLGKIVPGSSRLPSRHPFKISLLMALLGCLAAWLTVIVWLAALLGGIAMDHPLSYLILVFIALSSFGSFVLTPLSSMMGRRWTRLIPNIIVGVVVQIAGCAALIMVKPGSSSHPPRFDLIEVFPACAIISTGFAMWMARSAQRHRNRMRIATIIIGTVVGTGTITLVLPFVTNMIPHDTSDMNLGIAAKAASVFATGFSIWYSALAVCLGIPLWENSGLEINAQSN